MGRAMCPPCHASGAEPRARHGGPVPANLWAAFPLALLVLVCVSSPSASSYLTVSTTVAGHTARYIGGCEASEFAISEVVDSGCNVLRLWTKMDELEWWDDDDCLDGKWDNSEYGLPTIAQIKADAGAGFANTVPWSVWDERFDQAWWEGGTVSRKQIIQSCRDNGVELLVELRTVDDAGNPWWAPRPPLDQADVNEWWEHCFAVAYWLNVRNNFGVTHFEVLNEPDYNGQGWSPSGDQAGYVQMIQTASDAVRYANGMAGLDTYIHTPVVASYDGGWIEYCLQNADADIDVVDYHYYPDGIGSTVQSVQLKIAANDPDGVAEPIWITEFGNLSGSYNSVSEALRTASNVFDAAVAGAEGLTIFSLFSWPSPGGLVAPAHTKTESYYAYRLMLRALNGGRNRYQHTTDLTTRAMATSDSANLYIVAIDANATIQCDVSAFGATPTTATIYEYSATRKDVVTGTVGVVAGRFDLNAPANAIVLASVPLNPLAVRWPR